MRSLVGKEEAYLTFEEDTVYHSLHGVARLTKDNAQVSGDSFSVLELEGAAAYWLCQMVWVPESGLVRKVKW